MAEYSANAVQTVNPGETVVFTETSEPCRRGFVRHMDGTGSFLLSGSVPGCTCRCRNAEYFVDFGANIAIPEGQTVGEISVALTVDGATVPATTMIQTPAAVEEYSNISVAKGISVWNGCCESFAVRNTSSIPILVQNANIVFTRPDLAVTR